MSYYDKKTVVILKVLWYLVKNYLSEDQEHILKKIEQIIVFYKNDIKKKDIKWINYHVSMLNVILIEYKKNLNNEKLIALIFMVSERYYSLLRNETRKIVWNNLMTYSSNIINKSNRLKETEIDLVDRIYEEIVNDLLYLKNIEK